MKDFIEVHEFDYITYDEKYKGEKLNNAEIEDNEEHKLNNEKKEGRRKIHYLENEENFKELENFIHTFKDNKEAEAIDFLNITTVKNVGKVIQAKNYVGLIQLKSGFRVQVLPKISFVDKNNTKKIFIRMLRSMKDFPNKVFNEAGLKTEVMNLYEIFINLYIQEVRSLIKKGIKSAYLNKENNESFYKGRLVIKEQLRKNLAHKEKFYISYDEFDINRPENKLIKSTLMKLQKLSSNMVNIKEIRQLLIHFEMVNPSSNYSKDFSKVVIDRSTREYETIMRWSKVFLMNESFTTFSGNVSARALLFPMEKVFEAYVAKHLKKALAGIDGEIVLQNKGVYLFNTPEMFALKPDILIKLKSGRNIILDTKWKALINNPRKNYGISQADMYQMYAYAKKYETSEIWLLYPLNEDMKGAKDIDFISKDNVIVRLYFVDVSDIENSMNNLKLLLKLM